MAVFFQNPLNKPWFTFFQFRLEHYIRDIENPRGNDAKKQLIICGKGVGEKLIPFFVDPNYEEMRIEIMTMWAALNYKDAVPFIISSLEKEDKYWASLLLENSKWSLPGLPETERIQNRMKMRIVYAVRTLGSLHDSRAKDELLLVKKRWARSEEKYPSKSIAELCDQALAEIATSGGL